MRQHSAIHILLGREGVLFRAVLDQFYHEHVETFQLLYRIVAGFVARVHVEAISFIGAIIVIGARRPIARVRIFAPTGRVIPAPIPVILVVLASLL